MDITVAGLNKMVMEARLAGRTEAQLERVLMDMARRVLGDARNLLAVGVMIKGAISWAKVGKPFDVSRRAWEAQYGISRRACMAGDKVLQACGFRVGQQKRRGRVRTVYMLVDPGRFMAAFEAVLYGAECTIEEDDAVHNPPDAVHNPPDAVHNPPDAVHNPPDAVHNPPDAVHNPPDAVHSAPQPIVKSSPAAVHSAPDITRQIPDNPQTDTDVLPPADAPEWFDGFVQQATLQRMAYPDEIAWNGEAVALSPGTYRRASGGRALQRLAVDCGAPDDLEIVEGVSRAAAFGLKQDVF